MACPFFSPNQSREHPRAPRAAMLPLGDLWNGQCLAPAANRPSPLERPLLQTCNLGYARGTCPHFPSFAAADAVRFTIAGEDGDTVRICFVLEHDHHPLSRGLLAYSRERCGLVESPADPILARQASAYAASYIERVREHHAAR